MGNIRIGNMVVLKILLQRMPNVRIAEISS